MQYTDDVVLNCTVETCIILTSITPVNQSILAAVLELCLLRPSFLFLFFKITSKLTYIPILTAHEEHPVNVLFPRFWKMFTIVLMADAVPAFWMTYYS